MPRVQLQRNERLIRFDQLMLDGWNRFRPIRLRRLDLARASATDPVERRQCELVPGPALQSLQKMRVRLPIDHHFLPLGELAAVGQQESLDGGATIVALFPLQLDSVGRGAGGEQSRRGWRHCAEFRLIIKRGNDGDFEEEGNFQSLRIETLFSPGRANCGKNFTSMYFFFFRNYRPRSREFERNHTIRNRVDVSRNERV